jgi:hypothetical protein
VDRCSTAEFACGLPKTQAFIEYARRSHLEKAGADTAELTRRFGSTIASLVANR